MNRASQPYSDLKCLSAPSASSRLTAIEHAFTRSAHCSGTSLLVPPTALISAFFEIKYCIMSILLFIAAQCSKLHPSPSTVDGDIPNPSMALSTKERSPHCTAWTRFSVV
jgi:hypothetical protein